MPTNPEALRIDFPERLSGRWGRFTNNDWWFTGAALAIAVLTNHYFGSKGALFVLFVWLALTIPADYGRLYSLTGQWLSNMWIAKVRKQVIWDGDQESILAQPTPIKLAVQGINELGFLHDGSKDTIVVVGEGSHIPSQELEGQFDSHLAMAEVIRKAAALAERRGQDIGWGWVYRTRPLNTTDLNRRLERFLHPSTWSPAALDKPEAEWTDQDRRWLAYGENIQQLVDVTAIHTREVTMAAVCTVEREDFEKKLNASAAHRLPIAQMAQAVTAELEGCGVIDPRPLDPRGVHAYLRGSWDIAHIGDYYDWLMDSDDETVLTSDRHLPQERIKAGYDYLQVDGTFHTVLWLKQFPTRFYPQHLRQLFDIDIPWLSVAQVGTTTRTKAEYAFLDRVISMTDEAESWAGVIHKGPKRRERQEHRVVRQQKVHESRFGQDYNLLIAVHHISLDGLEDSVDKALQRISLANLNAERVVGQMWQLPFLLSATTAINIDML